MRTLFEVVRKIGKAWGMLSPEMKGVVTDLVQGAAHEDLQVRRAHAEALRRALFEARQKAKLG